MPITFPVRDDSHQTFYGLQFTLARNVQPSTMFEKQARLKLTDTGVQDGGDIEAWGIQKGMFLLKDKRGKILYRMDGAEVRNDSPYYVGEDMLRADAKGFARACMWSYCPMSNMNWGICVSSHADYYEKTLPRLFKSFRRYGVSMDKVVVVVGGMKEEAESEIEGAKVIYSTADYLGMTGVKAIGPEFDYWLLLHDTCEITESFKEKVGKVDVGLDFDMVTVLPVDRKFEIGFYSSDFILELRSSMNFSEVRKDKVFDAVHNRAQLVSLVGSSSRLAVSEAQSKDVYGGGKIRKVRILDDLGIKKYVGTDIIGGKP